MYSNSLPNVSTVPSPPSPINHTANVVRKEPGAPELLKVPTIKFDLQILKKVNAVEEAPLDEFVAFIRSEDLVAPTVSCFVFTYSAFYVHATEFCEANQRSISYVPEGKQQNYIWCLFWDVRSVLSYDHAKRFRRMVRNTLFHLRKINPVALPVSSEGLPLRSCFVTAEGTAHRSQSLSAIGSNPKYKNISKVGLINYVKPIERSRHYYTASTVAVRVHLIKVESEDDLSVEFDTFKIIEKDKTVRRQFLNRHARRLS